MIQEARREAGQLLSEGEAVVEKNMAQQLDQIREGLKKEKNRIIDEKSKETSSVKTYAEQNVDKAIPIILDIFERSVNAETPKDE